MTARLQAGATARMPRAMALATSLMPLLASLWPGHASAQQAAQLAAALQGPWQAGVTTMNVEVESWGEHCGPRPQSSRTEGGGTVQLTAQGKQLAIRGRGHVVRTDRCWSRNPAMRRVSSSYLDGVWTTHCKTAQDDPREEEGRYTIKRLGDGRLEYRDVSRYDWRLKDSACVATITTVQSLLRAQGSTPPRARRPTPEPAEEEHEDGEKATCVPGPPARLILGPTDAELEVGERLCLRTRVLDADGCRIRNPDVTFQLSHSPALKARMDGRCFVAANSAAEAEGEFRVTAILGPLRAQTTVKVRALDLSGLIAARLETGGVTGFESEAALPEPVTAPPATRVSTGTPRPRGSQARRPAAAASLVAAVGLILLLLAWLWVRRRAHRATSASAPDQTQDAAQANADAPGDPSNEPASGVDAAAVQTAAPDETWICPNCRHGYPARRRTCPNCPAGRNVLVPYAEFSRLAAREAAAHTKRCEDCGAEVARDANFCGQCGSRNLQT